MFKTLQNIYEYFFSPWNIEVIERGEEIWTRYSRGSADYNYARKYVDYKYSHKFRKQEKIVREYLN